MQLTLRDGLPLISVMLVHAGRELVLPDVVVDTGSATSMLAADAVSAIGLVPKPDDVLYAIRGVGGTEVVFSRRLDRLQVGSASIDAFDIQVGGMDYGFAINGILGMDFLLSAGAIIDLRSLDVKFV